MGCTNCKDRYTVERPGTFPKPCTDCRPKQCPDCNRTMIHRSDMCKRLKIYWCVNCRAEWQQVQPKETL